MNYRYITMKFKAIFVTKGNKSTKLGFAVVLLTISVSKFRNQLS
ncbi:hypothetical protein [Dolichospermum circinale]|nr:hypothetical protein [Dolichospermum circinale]MDB9453906.1 hypothetical protein [Dolichospermum circinale CS-541/06]MDB9461746.1 hypothetical protein [Dolichospermum circinale CS-541/04]MDB9548606.1 hypothetical protein [Dolichospermum circinale CS-1031]